MTDITREQVEHLGQLARIALSPDEVDALANDLSSIVDRVQRVRDAVGNDTPATSHPVPLTNVTRPDEPGPTLTHEEMFAGAPAHDGERFRVSSILGEEQ